MLTDEEKSGIIKQYTFGPDINALALVSEVERAVLAKAMPIPKQEPVALQYRYLNHETNSFGEWGDKIKGKTGGFQTRNLYADPQPAQAAAIPNKRPIPELLLASYHEAKGWNDCIDAMLSASPKP